MAGDQLHPCQRCGACCATFRVSFYWSEAVPAHLTEQLTPFRAHMKHSNEPGKPRCVALNGEIGKEVACGIYQERSTPCRDFEASFETGTPNPRCDKARANHGLPPLTEADWQN
jgi:hypothetical protein